MMPRSSPGIAPRWRLPFLFLGFVALAIGAAGGLARLTPMPVLPLAIVFHGPLMVSAFFGALISLERAAALDRRWAYIAPLCAGLGGLVLLSGFPFAGLVLMALGAASYGAASIAVLRQSGSLENWTLLAGAVSWLAGNVSLFFALPAVPWWMAFFALTIGAERLELSRYVKRPPAARTAFMVLAAALVVAPLEARLLGVVLVLLALWLLAFDIARITVRQKGLTRYVALCLLPGYAWLALGGALNAAALAYDAALHAVFLGFVFSMVFGHAPVILPAVLRVAFPYHPVLYVPLALLHLSLAVRVFFSVPLGAWGNVVALALFIVAAAGLVLGNRRKLAVDQRRAQQPR